MVIKSIVRPGSSQVPVSGMGDNDGSDSVASMNADGVGSMLH